MAENRKEEYLKLKIRIRKRVVIIVGCVVLVLFLYILYLFLMSNQGLSFIMTIVLLTLIIFGGPFLISIGGYIIVKKKYVKFKFGIEDKKRRLRRTVVMPEQEKQKQSQQVVIQQTPQIPQDMKACIHCGNFIKRTAKFCDDCGKEQ